MFMRLTEEEKESTRMSSFQEKKNSTKFTIYIYASIEWGRPLTTFEYGSSQAVQSKASE